MSQLPKGHLLSDDTLLALVRAGCRSKPDVGVLSADVLVALSTGPMAGVMRYRLGSDFGAMSDETLCAL